MAPHFCIVVLFEAASGDKNEVSREFHLFSHPEVFFLFYRPFQDGSSVTVLLRLHYENTPIQIY